MRNKEFIRHLFIWGLCMMMWMPSAHAQAPRKADAEQAKEMTRLINEAAMGIHSLDCRFTQVKRLHFIDDEMTSQGSMLFLSEGGGKLRWEYEQPYRYTFVINDGKAHIKSANGQQTIDMSQSRLFQGIAEIMLNSVTGKGLTTGTDFSCTMFTAGGNEWIARLTPKRKEMKRLFKDIALHFSKQKQIVTQVEMTEPSGDTTVITLKEIKKNGQLDKKMFAIQ